MYYHIGEDKNYLKLVYDALKDFDNYLWTYRDSTGDDCLESWCIWDVGEDNSTLHMLHGLRMPDHGPWGKCTPPADFHNMPHKSPQYMGYSYACRNVLAQICEILDNGEAAQWAQKAKFVQQKAAERLWDKDKNAYFVRDKDGEFIYALTQENIKCMYSGLMTQEMADTFIREHLLNKEEFWTPYPLPAIAANSPYFHVNDKYSNCADKLKALGSAAHDIDDNSWSGPLAGLTWQRSIEALLNYEHHAEIVLVGKKVLELLAKTKKFIQNYNPFTGEPAKGDNGYGPTMLAALEFISMICGVNAYYDSLYWSAAEAGNYEYVQNIRNRSYTIRCEADKASIYADGELKAQFTTGVRIKTDMNGEIKAIYGIDEKPVQFELTYKNKTYSALINPNEEFAVEGEHLILRNKVPFDYKG